ncbi:heme ABC transporter ATP-binding protein [Vibrio hepatarius]|uniref:heme ABC transporter ATP-binding protein n=1 Tax=Vibrio hepatarius TaxID=171383 RepID=UPI001C07F22E|nr:heme ABC transporter ATP-binding protein [Vibrio hepatarius]MBU2895727.1 heme ABC transporter ATP-binding protein [Vibrio hepatarius]
MLSCRNLTANYRKVLRTNNNQLATKPALNVAYLSIDEGTHTGILGANGAGKSTLLKSLSGDVEYQGDIHIMGKERKSWSPHVLATHLAVLPQSTQLMFSFTVVEVVRLGLLNSSLNLIQKSEMIRHIMQRSDVLDLAQRNFLTLSGGQQQRVLFAKALCQISSLQESTQQYKNKLLFLDEPIAALDVYHQHHLLQGVKEIAAKLGTVISVLHDLNLAARYCDRLILMHQGEIIADGPQDKVLTEDNIQHAYGYKSSIIRHPSEGYLMIS